MHPLPKIPTGIGGFDELSRGGLPRGRTTLLKGGPGSGDREKELRRIRSADPARPVSTSGHFGKGNGKSARNAP